MTIRFSHESKCYIAQCDQCFDVVDFDHLRENSREGFQDAKDAIDIDGWKTVKSSNGWRNICYGCK